MKTKFSSLVKLKKNKMQESEQGLSKANIALSDAKNALEESYLSLDNIEEPQEGTISSLSNSHIIDITKKFDYEK